MPEGKYRFLDRSQLEALSLRTAKRYLSGEKKTVKDAVLDILKEEKELLSPEHVRRVVELTNTNVLQNLFATQKEKTIGFPLANAEEILKVYSTEPIKAEKTDYDIPPQQHFKAVIDTAEKERGEKAKEILKEVLKAEPVVDAEEKGRYQLKAASANNKWKIAGEWVVGELYNLNHTLKTAEQELKDTIKSELLNYNLSLTELQKLAEDRNDLTPYLREIFLSFIKNKQYNLVSDIIKQAEKIAVSEDARLDESNPIIKMLNVITASQQRVDALLESLDIIKTKEFISKREMLNSGK